MQLNFVVLRVNQERLSEALAELGRMEPRLLRRAGTLVYTTEQAWVRGQLLFSLANFQDIVRKNANVVVHRKDIGRLGGLREGTDTSCRVVLVPLRGSVAVLEVGGVHARASGLRPGLVKDRRGREGRFGAAHQLMV